jgi:hypothetical protein
VREEKLESYLTEPDTEEVFIAFIKYLNGRNRDNSFSLLSSVFWEDFIPFLMAFEGKTIRIPNLHYLKRSLQFCKIWTYMKQEGFSDEGYVKAAKIFKRKNTSIRKIVERVNLYFDREEKYGREPKNKRRRNTGDRADS